MGSSALNLIGSVIDEDNTSQGATGTDSIVKEKAIDDVEVNKTTSSAEVPNLNEKDKRQGSVGYSFDENVDEVSDSLTIEVSGLEEYNMINTDEVEIGGIGLDSTLDLEESEEEVFEMDPKDIVATCELSDKQFASSDIELVNISRFVKEVKNFKIFDYKDRRIICSRKMVNEQVVADIKSHVISRLKQGKTANVVLVKEHIKFNRNYSSFIISYGDLEYLCHYFKKYNPQFRTVKDRDGVIVNYLLTVGI